MLKSWQSKHLMTTFVACFPIYFQDCHKTSVERKYGGKLRSNAWQSKHLMAIHQTPASNNSVAPRASLKQRVLPCVKRVKIGAIDRGRLFAPPKKHNFNGVNQTGRREEQPLPSSNLIGIGAAHSKRRKQMREGADETGCLIRSILTWCKCQIYLHGFWRNASNSSQLKDFLHLIEDQICVRQA